MGAPGVGNSPQLEIEYCLGVYAESKICWFDDISPEPHYLRASSLEEQFTLSEQLAWVAIAETVYARRFPKD